MEARLYTVHRKGTHGLRFVGDGFSLFALLVPPVWAIWHGLWITLVAMIGILVLATMYHPFAVSPVLYGLGLILAFDGGPIRRLELSLRGWREVSVVEARSEEGAEELWMTGLVA